MRKLVPLSLIVAEAEERGEDLAQMLVCRDDISTIDDVDSDELADNPGGENPEDLEE
jgi:hypothetical protein